jgi:LacI family transcriptional regulator
MRAILEAGLRIPEDVAVVGCGNLSYSDFLRVSLSSVDQGSETIGKHAADLALRIARKKTHTKPKAEFISPRVVVRASSRRFPDFAEGDSLSPVPAGNELSGRRTRMDH